MPKEAFHKINSALKHAGADQDKTKKVDIGDLRRNLFNGRHITEQDAKDLILYLSQHGFKREEGQERNEIKPTENIDYYEDYIAEARKLGLIDRIEPKSKEYNYALIAGASRLGLWCRLIDYKYNIEKYELKIKNAPYTLAGQREVWLEIDSVPHRLKEVLGQFKNLDNLERPKDQPGDDALTKAESQEYMIELAKKFNIELNQAQPFISYKTKEECPEGRSIGRTYPNYAEANPSVKLTETILAKDLMQKVLGTEGLIIDTLADENNSYPCSSTRTIYSTVRNFALILSEKIKKGEYTEKEFIILLQVNQPYVKRMTITANSAFNQILKEQGLSNKVKIEGIGFQYQPDSYHQEVNIISGELAALIAEKYKEFLRNHPDSSIKLQKRHIKYLLYQTRDNNSDVPSMPEKYSGSSSQLIEPKNEHIGYVGIDPYSYDDNFDIFS